jgi:hypothetical protein
LYAKFSKCKF